MCRSRKNFNRDVREGGQPSIIRQKRLLHPLILSPLIILLEQAGRFAGIFCFMLVRVVLGGMRPVKRLGNCRSHLPSIAFSAALTASGSANWLRLAIACRAGTAVLASEPIAARASTAPVRTS
jgi:hypothetical protein